MDPREGTQVTPAIRLVRPLNKGGMGSVWVAEHAALRTQVVVKFMADEIAKVEGGADRFAREASVSAAVKSPHVVQVFDHGISDGRPYIVMELLEGRDLSAHLARNGPMTPHDVAAMIAQVAKGLGKAHQVGVIHRDIKPDNIFLCDGTSDESGTGEMFVKLLDFGIAKNTHLVEGTATTTGMVVGTPFYMSPEQIVGTTLDARSDIWSLGVVAFEALTGRRPFEGATVGAVTLSIHTAHPRITQFMPNLPPALDDWFARACAQDPNGRFASAREAANALLVAAGEAVAPARLAMPSLVEGSAPMLPVSRAETHLSSSFVAEPPKKKPPIALAVGAGAVVLGLGVLAIVAMTKRAPTAPVTTSALVTGTASEPAAIVVVPPSAVPPPTDTAPAASAEPSAIAAATSSAPATRPTARPGTKPGQRPVRPTKKRDDDDIK